MPADFEGSSPKVLRIGILGAARIAPAALIRPARLNPDVTVEAVASRDPASAARFAAKQAIPFVREDYDALINYSGIDAVYVPLPNALHAKWAIRALEAGKHVLCEKPLTSNADEAVQVAATAERTGRVLMEAFHYRYHPLAQRLRDIVDSGELGELLEVQYVGLLPDAAFLGHQVPVRPGRRRADGRGMLRRASCAASRSRGAEGRAGTSEAPFG